MCPRKIADGPHNPGLLPGTQASPHHQSLLLNYSLINIKANPTTRYPLIASGLTQFGGTSPRKPAKRFSAAMVAILARVAKLALAM
jgi:hypothetical protein